MFYWKHLDLCRHGKYDASYHESLFSSTWSPFFRFAGCAITSTGSSFRQSLNRLSDHRRHLNHSLLLQNLQIFTTLLPSFCRTATVAGQRYVYHFYLGHDRGDPLFDNRDWATSFLAVFRAEVAKWCGARGVLVTCKLVQCTHTGHPAWAQNDAMMEAYLDGAEFFYRVNDDTRMASSRWTELFIETLDRSSDDFGVIYFMFMQRVFPFSG